jgi:hypothetical protein
MFLPRGQREAVHLPPAPAGLGGISEEGTMLNESIATMEKLLLTKNDVGASLVTMAELRELRGRSTPRELAILNLLCAAISYVQIMQTSPIERVEQTAESNVLCAAHGYARALGVTP